MAGAGRAVAVQDWEGKGLVVAVMARAVGAGRSKAEWAEAGCRQIVRSINKGWCRAKHGMQPECTVRCCFLKKLVQQARAADPTGGTAGLVGPGKEEETSEAAASAMPGAAGQEGGVGQRRAQEVGVGLATRS